MSDVPSPEQAARELWEQYAQTGKESDFLMYARRAFEKRDESMREAGRREGHGLCPTCKQPFMEPSPFCSALHADTIEYHARREALEEAATLVEHQGCNALFAEGEDGYMECSEKGAVAIRALATDDQEEK